MMTIYAIALVIVAGAVMLAKSWRRCLAFVAFAVFAWAAAVDALGTPKPIWAEVRDHDKLVVVASHFEPNKRIWIWTADTPPVAYELPWSTESAAKLQKAQREAQEQGAPRIVIEGDPYGEWMAYPEPYREMPAKVYE